MIGIVLLSHGGMASGMADSAKLFFGGEVAQLAALGLNAGDSPEAFDEKIREAVKKTDDGHGVLIFCDLMGGTPGNRAGMMLQDEEFAKRCKIITGMNLTMLLEFLGQRAIIEDIDDVDQKRLMETGRKGITCINDLLNN